MTKAEKAARSNAWWFYTIMQIPAYRGPNFNEASFDIEEYVDGHLFRAYKSGRVPPKSRHKALALARKTWDKLVKENK